MNTTQVMRQLMASATLATGLAVGFAAATHAQPNHSAPTEYWECVADHPDKVGAETCCVFYGGTWDPSHYMYECSLDRGEEAKSRFTPAMAGALPELTVNPGPSAPSTRPGLTTSTPVVSRG
jgi:hypothetical protein